MNLSILSKFICLKLFIISLIMCLIYIRFVYTIQFSFLILINNVFSLVSVPVFRNFINHFKYQFWLYYFILWYVCFVFYWFLLLPLLLPFSYFTQFWFGVLLYSWYPSICHWFFSLSLFFNICLQCYNIFSK